MNLGLHKELYFFEWSRKEQLASSANLPVALLTVLAGGVLFLIQSFPYHSDVLTSVFLIFSSGSIIAQVLATYFLVRSLFGYWYEQIPDSDKLQAFFVALKNYHVALGHTKELLQQEFDEYLQERLAEATASNRKNNTQTAGALHKATASIIFALIFTGLSFVPYLTAKLSQPIEPAKVQVVGPVNVQ